MKKDRSNLRGKSDQGKPAQTHSPDLIIRGIKTDPLLRSLIKDGGSEAFDQYVQLKVTHADRLRMMLKDPSPKIDPRLIASYQLAMERGLSQVTKSKPDEVIPPTAEWLLAWVMGREQREELLGDLHEIFVTDKLPVLGKSAAQIWFWSQVLRSVFSRLPAGVMKAVKWSVLGAAVRWLWRSLAG